MFVTPLETEETQITTVANNGHAMALVLYLTLHLVNGFNPVQVTNTILVSVVSAICFITIMYFFNALLGKVGSFFMLVFMVLQLAGSAGTYPIEISGSFAAAIHKYVPFTYTVNAFSLD